MAIFQTTPLICQVGRASAVTVSGVPGAGSMSARAGAGTAESVAASSAATPTRARFEAVDNKERITTGTYISGFLDSMACRIGCKW